MISENKEYASKGVAGTGLGLGIAGTALGLLAGNGGGFLNGILGGNNCAAAVAQKDAVIAQQGATIAELRAERDTDRKIADLYGSMVRDNKELTLFLTNLDKRVTAVETAAPLQAKIVDQQIARVVDQINCCCNASNAAIANLQATINGVTKIVIPNTSVCPGWGNVTITPQAATAAAA